MAGEGEADPQRGQQHRQRGQREGDLDGEASRFEIGLLGDGGLGVAVCAST
jgi:hypothetical protein